MQYNESYNARSPDVDGGCYDIDWATRNNIYQYNYGHDCDGYCISVFGAGGLVTENAIVRYNVCANNGQDTALASRQGDVFLSTWDGGYLDGVLIHNNTFYWNPDGTFAAVENNAAFIGERPNIFANNIIVSTVPWMVNGGNGLDLDHNIYWLEGDDELFFSFGRDYYKGFKDYQDASAQDAHSMAVDPRLNNPTYHEVGFPEKEFTLRGDSPAIDAGIELGAMGDTDFFGNPIPVGNANDIGAHEWTPEKSGFGLQHGLVGILDVLSPFASTAEILLVGLVNPQDDFSKSQVVFLRSIAQQLKPSGLDVVLVDVSGLSDIGRFNLAQSWHIDDIPLLSINQEISTPSTLLFKAGKLHSYWGGIALPFDLGEKLELLLKE